MTSDEVPPILILDPSCNAAHGHHLTSLLDLIAALPGAPVDVVVNAAMRPGAFPPPVREHALFATTVYDEPGLGPRPNGRLARRVWKLRRTGNVAAAAAHRAALGFSAGVSAAAALAAQDWAWSRWRIKWPELAGGLSQVADRPVAHIVVPSSDVELVCGLAELRSTIPNLAGAKIHARLITLSPQTALLRPPAAASEGYRALIEQRMAGVHLYVETPAMQRHLRATFALPSEVYPYLLSPPALQAPPPATSPMAAFGYFGAMRNEKGFSRLLPILRTVGKKRATDDPALSFLVHASDAKGSEADQLRAAFLAVAGPGLAIEFISGPLEAADYARRFAAIDATLLPYTGTRYRLSGSGILCEALAMGKAVIFSEGLSFGDFCNADNAIEAAGDDGFADAILNLARNLPRYRNGAAARARAYAAQVRDCALLSRLRGG